MIDSLVIGNGEVGSSIYSVLLERQDSRVCDITGNIEKDFQEKLDVGCRVLHISFPYSEQFTKDVIYYKTKTKCELVIIHSTVQVGTTTYLNMARDVPTVHSPVRGQHPKLHESLLKFVKYIGTEDKKAYDSAAKEMSNMPCKWVKKPEATELGKLLSTSYYGLCIAWHRDMKRICDELDVDFDEAVTDFNKTYNEGYSKFRPNVIRPVLTPPEGEIGGHCVVQNARILEEKIHSDFLTHVR